MGGRHKCRYAGIGSRETPDDILWLQFQFGKLMCTLGWHGISGLCYGPDENYYLGAKESPRFGEVGFTNVIPWNGFSPDRNSKVRYFEDESKGIFSLKSTGMEKRAFWLGIGARGGDWGLKKGGIALHSRNPFQILDVDLKHRVRFVHCYAPPNGPDGHVHGGTGTAVALAIHYGIDVINLATKQGMDRTLSLFIANGVDLDYEKYRGMYL